MDYYETAIRQLLGQPHTRIWTDLQTVCERALLHKPVAWHFPMVACEAVGGQAEAAIPAVKAITCAHMAIILIDDILDEDPRGVYRQIGTGRAANLASGLFGLGAKLILESNCKERAAAAVQFSNLVLDTACGQSLDIQNLQTEEGYWQVAHAKSSPYFSAALSIGALFGGASLETAQGLHAIGEIYGEIMQIHDDLNDCLAMPANVDWLQSKAPLPILFAQIVHHPLRDRFLSIRLKVDDPVLLQEAQQILVSSGAISYCVNEIALRSAKAKTLLSGLDLQTPDLILQLLDEAMAPVDRLHEKLRATA